MKNILVINVNWMGDVIFSSPVFRALRREYPLARIVCMAPPRVKEILESIEDIDEIIIYDEKGRHWNPLKKVAFALNLRKQNFDAAFILHGSKTRARIAKLAKIPERVGYDTKKRGALLTTAIPCDGQNTTMHRSDYYLRIIEEYGIDVIDRTTELTVDQQAEIEIDEILKNNCLSSAEKFIVVNTGGNWQLKQWPKKSFTVLINQLMEQGHKVVVSGASKDVLLVESICCGLKNKPVVLAGKTNLKQLMALMKKAEMVISADSGPLHLASSVGTKTIGLYGPTRVEVTGPRGRGAVKILQNDVGCNRKPCYYLECPDNICMQAITVKDVLREIEKN